MRRVGETKDDPGSGQRDEPGRDPGPLEPRVQLALLGGRALALVLDALDLSAQVEDLLLELLLLRLERERRRDQRRPLLGRVADEGTFGAELGGDEEAEREEREAERHLP